MRFRHQSFEAGEGSARCRMWGESGAVLYTPPGSWLWQLREKCSGHSGELGAEPEVERGPIGHRATGETG